ncbi:MAG: hypothetical protein KDC34_08035 [Saprospiraceae bacterium]|nr:hypothetical protein [Saprospiraceae bacterium]
MHRIILPFLFGMLLIFSCHPKTIPSVAPVADGIVLESSTEAPAIDTFPVVPRQGPRKWLSFVRFPCYGKCPAYALELYSDGRAVYSGSRFVKRKGFFEAYFSTGLMTEILDKANEIHFFDLPPKYPENGQQIPELPRTLILFQLPDIVKGVEFTYGQPDEINDFVKYLDQLIEGHSWRSIPDPYNSVE